MQGQPNLNCKQMEEALDAYYDFELSAEEAEAVDLHLADCPACSAKLADIDMVVTKLKTLAAPELEWKGDLSDAIEARILAQAATSAQSAQLPSSSVRANNIENVVPISSSPRFAGYLKPRYILASAASIVALFFAYNQFAPGQQHAAEVALVKKNASIIPDKQLAAVPISAGPNEFKKVEVAKVATSPKPLTAPLKVATLPELKIPAKPVRVETTTEKMLASSEQTGRDSNNNNVNDSEEIVAVYDYDTIDSASDFGISTNEDGLYAIKL